jgi:hypothetical protein
MIDDPYHYETFRTYYFTPAAAGIVALIAAVIGFIVGRATRRKD